MSVKFDKACFNHLNKVLIHSTIKNGIHGVPNCVIHKEKNNLKRKEEEYRKTKASTSVGNSFIPDLILTSVYITKPVYFMSISCEKTGWVVNESKV